MANTSLPTGTVTFLFTDIEGSTRLWETHPDAMADALARHDELLRACVEAQDGHVVKTTGDGIFAVFGVASDALGAALDAQLALTDETWGPTGPLRVRMGIHTGAADAVGGDYHGPQLNRAARLMSAAHGGQVLVSGATAPLVVDHLPQGAELVALGEHRLRDLGRPEVMYELVHPDLPRQVQPLRTLDAYPGNLPLQLSSFIGRERELTRTLDALDQARIVTLTGVGGVGKTRLALQVAGSALPAYREGAWLIELGPVRDPDGVLSACMSTFGVTAGGGRGQLESLVEFLRPKQLLVVLDNCEHLLEPVADLVEVIERSCPGISVLATSREGLAVEGERVVPIPSLGQPRPDAGLAAAAEADAVRLFVDRAAAADPDFALDEANCHDVARVCSRLDGVPLAIELAAARVRSMTPAELADGLDRRFATLAGGRRRAVERHQTLRAAIDWSYDLLEPAEQALLDRLAVFAGGCTRHAAEQVCAGPPLDSGSVFGALANLVAKSLVDSQRDGADTRFRLLETIRAYGEEHLAEKNETELWRHRHAEYYTAFAVRVGQELLGRDELALNEAWVAEVDNMLLALAHLVDTGDVDLASRLFTAGLGSGGFTIPRRLPGGEVLAMPGAADHPLYPVALAIAGTDATLRGDPEAAVSLFEQARTLDDGSEPLVDQLWTYAEAMMAVSAGDQRTAAAHMERAAALLGNTPALQAQSLASAAVFAVMAGELERAEADARPALELARRIGAPSINIMALTALAGALVDSDRRGAERAFREACELWPADRDTSRVLVQIVFIGARIGAWPEVLERAGAAVRFLHWNGDRPQLAAVLNVVAAAVADARPDQAAVLLGAASTLASWSAPVATSPSDPDPPSVEPAPPRAAAGNFIAEVRRAAVDRLRADLGGKRLDDLRRQGRALPYQDVLSYALEAIGEVRRPTDR